MVATSRDVDGAEVLDRAKQSGCTTGCPHAEGSAIPELGKLGTWNKTLRSALSICSSFRYWALLSKAPQDPPQADLRQQVRVPECDRQGDLEGRLPVLLSHADPLRAERLELRGRERARAEAHVELAVDHSVAAIPDRRELIRHTRVDGRVVALIGIERDAQCGEELGERDELNLRPHDARA